MAKKSRKPAAPKKRNAQDMTLRNNRANARRDSALKEQVGSMSTTVQDLQRRVEALEAHTRINMPPMAPLE